MKYLTMITTLLVSMHAWGVSECGGRTSEGLWVTVYIHTTGPTGIPEQGEVKIENEDNKFGYRFSREDISQYFEYDEVSDNTAMIGLAAYVNKESPVSLKYNGPNFVDMDLKTVIQEEKVKGLQGNFLRLWKGPGHAANDQYQLTNLACSTWLNI